MVEKCVLFLNHYPSLDGHSGGRKLYHRIGRHFYWSVVVIDCYDKDHKSTFLSHFSLNQFLDEEINDFHGLRFENKR